MSIEAVGVGEATEYEREVSEDREEDKITKISNFTFFNLKRVSQCFEKPTPINAKFFLIKKQLPVFPFSSNPVDLVIDVTNAMSDARSGNWGSAMIDSLDVAQDVIDISKEVGEAFIESRIDAVENDYAENSDVGFQLWIGERVFFLKNWLKQLVNLSVLL